MHIYIYIYIYVCVCVYVGGCVGGCVNVSLCVCVYSIKKENSTDRYYVLMNLFRQLTKYG